MKNLPKNHHQLADYIYRCIDLSGYEEGSTLSSIILSEGFTASPKSVEDWLRGLPSACTIPFTNHDINLLLESSKNTHWTIDDYWWYCANRVYDWAFREQYNNGCIFHEWNK